MFDAEALLTHADSSPPFLPLAWLIFGEVEADPSGLNQPPVTSLTTTVITMVARTPARPDSAYI